jgi:hypothetical protein
VVYSILRLRGGLIHLGKTNKLQASDSLIMRCPVVLRIANQQGRKALPLGAIIDLRL